MNLNRLLTNRLTEDDWKILSPLENKKARSAETLIEIERPDEIVRALFRRGVLITEKPEGIRVATHFFNNEEDIEKLINTLQELRH